MKKCFVCRTIYPGSKPYCPICKTKTAIVSEFTSRNSEYDKNGGFNADFFSQLVKLEDNHFWFRARNRIIISTLKKFTPEFKTFLEIGCGTGYVLSGIAKAFPEAEFSGCDIYPEGLFFASARLPEVKLLQIDAGNIPFFKEFDVIGAFDVLEHIEYDEVALSQINSALKENGYVIITVPQHKWLWSSTDVYACHVRRYSVYELHQKIVKSGFRIIYSTSFVTLLLPLLIFSRFISKNNEEFSPLKEMRIHPLANKIMESILNFEHSVIKHGYFPRVGGSRIVVAKKVYNLHS